MNTKRNARSQVGPVFDGRANTTIRMRTRTWFPTLCFICAIAAWATPAMAIVRTWTGNVDNTWSNPGNWSPGGAPQNGDDLNFPDASNTTMNNDLIGLSVEGLYFGYSSGNYGSDDYDLSGNTIQLTYIQVCTDNLHSRTITIHCGLVLTNGVTGPQISLCPGDNVLNDPNVLRLDGQLDINGTYLELNSGGGDNGNQLYFSGSIIGTGTIYSLVAGDCDLIFDGPDGNTFSGLLVLKTYSNVNFNKQSGFVVNGSVVFGYGPVYMQHAEQFGPGATVELDYNGNTLQFNGFSQTFSNLVLRSGTNFATPNASGPTVDTGSGSLTLLGSLTSWQLSPGDPIATIKGTLNLSSGSIPINLTNDNYAALDMQAQITGPGGFTVDGTSAILLEASNSFTGSVVIDSGTVDAHNNESFGPSGSGVQLNGGTLALTGVAIPAEPLYAMNPNSLLVANGANSWNGPVILTTQLLAYSFGSLQFNGAISGAGNLLLVGETFGLGGSMNNTFTGTAVANSSLLTLGKTANAVAMSGPLVIGNSTGPACEVRWLDNFQLDKTTEPITLFPGALMNLNGFDDLIGSLTFTGGTVSNSSGGVLGLYQFVTVNSNLGPAIIDGGELSLTSGMRPFDVEPGPLQPELGIGAAIVGGGRIYKTGNGILDLYGNSSFSGGMEVADGIAAVASVNGLGGTGGGVNTVDSGATLQANNSLNSGPFSISGSGVGGTDGAISLTPGASISANVTLTANATVLVNSGTGYLLGAISGPGGLTKTGAGSLQLGNNDTNPNTYGGLTQVSGGTLALGKASSVNSVPGDLIISGAHQAATAQNVNSFQIGGVVTINTGGTWNLAGNSDGTTVSALQGRPALSLIGVATVETGVGTFYLATGANVQVNPLNGIVSTTASISGNVGLAPGTHHFVVNTGASHNNGPDLDLAATITELGGSAAITKDGIGVMSLDVSNNFSGPVTVTGGSLLVHDSNAMGTGPGLVTNSGALYLDTAVFLATPLTFASSAQPALAIPFGGSDCDGPVVLTSNTVISVADPQGSLGFDGGITGPGGWTKIGPGTLLLDGVYSNTFSGPNVISNGLFEATMNAYVPALGGSVNVGDDVNPATNATFYFSEGQLGPTIDVTVHQSGLFDTEYSAAVIHTLSGRGYATVGQGLTISNDVSSEFDGVLSGPGPIDKFSGGTLKFTSNSPAYTGLVSVYSGTYQADGALPNSPVMLFNSTLTGNGVVGDVNTFGSGSLVKTDNKLTDHYGGALSVSNFTVANGTVSLNFYGASPTRGDDRLIANGAVNLTNEQLNAAFLYPPQQGDNVIAVQKNSAGPINGQFNGFADGTLTTIGTVPVFATYEGGDGNDFALIVTNLALAFDGYRLTGGNGNQTVEPNECNLLYVTLISQRTNTVIITNTFLRCTTPYAEVIIPQATFPPIAPNSSAENTTPFQFRTDPSLPCESSVGMQLVIGVQGEGLISIPFPLVAGTDCTHPTGPCEFPVVTTNTFTSNSPIVSQPLLFDSDPSVCYPAKNCPGPDPSLPTILYQVYNYTNSALSNLCIGAQAQYICTNAPSNSLGAVAYLGNFDPTQPCTGYMGDNGGNGSPYSTFYFNVPPGAPFSVVVMDRAATNLACATYTLEMFGLPNQAPTILSVWTNVASGDWNTISNWDTHILPNVTSNAAVQSGYTVTITNNLPVTLYELKYNSSYSTITGTGDINIDTPFNWIQGSFGGQSSVYCNGGVQIPTGPGIAGKGIDFGTMVNNAAGAWTGPNGFGLGNSATFSNSPAGTFDCAGDGTLQNSSGANVFANAGLFRKTGGSNSTIISTPFNNSGTAQVQVATLDLSGGLANSGVIIVSNGATLMLGNGNTSTSTPSSSITGAGNLVISGSTANLAGTVNLSGSNTFNGGTATFTGPYTCTNNALTISGAAANFDGTGTINPATLTLSGYSTLGGSNLVTVSGPVLLNPSASLSGTNLVVANGGLTIASGMSISGRTLVNTTTGLWESSQGGVAGIGLSYGGVLSNAPGASFEFSSNSTVGFSSSGGFVANAGLLRKTAAGTTSTIEVPLTNTGPISIESGTLGISGGGTTTANITVAAGAGIQFGGGTFTEPPGVSITGPAGSFTVSGGTANFAGTVNLGGSNTISFGTANFSGPYICTNNALTIGGTANFNGNGTIAPATLTVNMFGTLAGSNLVTVSGPAVLGTASAVSGANLLVANGGLTISGGMSLSGRTLVNTAAALWTNSGSASINFDSGAVLSNAPGGTFAFNIGLVGFFNGGGNGGAIVNQGLFRKFGSATTTTIELPIFNYGTVEVDSGTLSVNFNSVSYVQNAGTTFLNGGNFANNVPLQILGGSLTGTGLISGSVTNAGLLSPGSPIGQITVSGSYVQTSAGAMQIDLGGTNPVTGFDQLVVSNATKLAGALTVHITNGFVPSVSNQFQILVCPNVTGTFSTLNVPTGISVNYSNTGVFLVVTSAVAVPVLLQNPQIQGGNFTFSFQTETGQSYTIQDTTNLDSTVWTNLTNFDGNGALFHFVGPLTNLPPTFFRVREP